MHYKTEELYIYWKEGGKDPAIASHLASCPDCRENSGKALRISGLFRSAMEEPPPMRAAQTPVKSRNFFPRILMKPAFALTFSLVLFFSGAVVVKKVISDRQRSAAVPAFVYETYSSIYDFDYYTANYIDKTEIKLNGGVQNEKN